MAVACSASHPQPASVPSTVEIREAPTYTAAELGRDVRNLCEIDPSTCERPSTGGGEILLTGQLAGAPAVRNYNSSVVAYSQTLASSVTSPSSQSAPPVPPSPLPAGKRPELGDHAFDIEAHVEIEVARVSDGVSGVIALVRAAGGELVNEAIEDKPSLAGASLSLRVPSDRVEAFLDELRRVGRVRSRRVESTELGRKQRDARILLEELELSLKRYEELLARAQNVSEMTPIEEKLSETRTAIERVKNDIAWMSDRVARSTVYVTLYSKIPEAYLEAAEPKLHPGVRLTNLIDVPPSGPASTFIGGGISMWIVRAFSFDLDLFTGLGGPDKRGGVDFLIASLGGELYSDYLGGGRRRWLNPYLGFRAGYARSAEHSQFALGGSLGVEIYRSTGFFVDLQSRFYGLIGRPDGTHFGLQPLLGVNFAY
jgi:hypothetical protein